MYFDRQLRKSGLFDRLEEHGHRGRRHGQHLRF
ncbi:MAG: hypothetical protein ACLS3C_08940 [Oscillospiraceae bacterium]